MVKGLVVLFLCFSSFELYSEVCWVDSVIIFSSQKGEKQFSANQVIGKPNSFLNENTPTSWMPTITTKEIYESIFLSFRCNEPSNFIYINMNSGDRALKSINVISTKSEEISFEYPSDKFQNNNGKITLHLDKSIKISGIKLYFDLINSKLDVLLDAVGISNELCNPWVIDEYNENLFESESENMGIRINSIYTELAPVISSDGRKLFYTRDGHPNNIGAEKNQDVWMSEVEADGRFGKSVNLFDPINNRNNNFAFSTNSDGTSLLLGRNALNHSSLSFSEYKNNNWSKLKEFEFSELNNKTNYVNYSLSKSGKTMYISMEREDSFGGLDIYSSTKNENGWSEPTNLGSVINTSADEISPFIADDNETLFFASNGFPGYGSMDLFVSKVVKESDNWSPPKNLGSKINSEGWEAYLTMPSDNLYAYYVSTSNSIGKEDIFRIKLPVQISPKTSTIVSGKVFELGTVNPLAAKVVFQDLKTNKNVGIAYSDSETGYYQITLPTNKFYGLNANADGYYSISQSLDFDSISKERTEINLELKRITIGEIYDLNNIFFEFGKSILNNKSENELQRLVSFLHNNQNIKIRIIGYTDQIGSEKSNLILSKERAKSVYTYLINSNISENRLSFEGKGELKSNKNGNLEKSRKVVFKIIEDNR